MKVRKSSIAITLLIAIETTKHVSSGEASAATTWCDSNNTVATMMPDALPRLQSTWTGNNDTIMKEAACLLQKYGAVIIDDLVSSEGMDLLTRDLERDVSGTFFGAPGSFAGAQTTRNAAKPLGESRVAQALAVHPIVLGVVDAILSPYTKRIILGTCSAITVVGPRSAAEPPAPAQVYHRDDSMWAGDWITNLACRGSMSSMSATDDDELSLSSFPNLSVSVMWAVSDFTADNGATRLALLSHRQCPRTAQAPTDMTFHPAVMKKGSVVLWLGGTFHGAGASSPWVGDVDTAVPPSPLPPREPRRGLLYIYNLGYLRSEHNFFHAIPPNIIAKFDAPLRDLLGYHGDNPVIHPWYTGPVYSQPYLGSPEHGNNTAGGEGVQYAVEPDSVWEVTQQGDVVSTF
jgi:hypothetical protein